MIPIFKIGLFNLGEPFPLLIREIFGSSQDVVSLHTPPEVESFLDNVSFPEWKLLLARWDDLCQHESLLSSLINNYLKIDKTFHLILFATDNTDETFPLISEHENTHILSSTLKATEELHHHLQEIKNSLELYWLYAKTTDVLRIYEDLYSKEIDHERRFEEFIDKLRDKIRAQNISIFFLQNGANEFSVETKVNAPPFTSIARSVAEELFEFNEVCLTYTILPQHRKRLAAEKIIPESLNNSLLISTFKVDTIPGFILYSFEDSINEVLLRSLCNIISREIFHLYRSNQIRSRHDCLKALTETKNLNSDKQQIILEILRKLKQHFHVEGVAVLEYGVNEDNKTVFRKYYVERQNYGDIEISAEESGFANYSLNNKKALVITNVHWEADKPFGLGFEFDPDALRYDKGKPVKLPTFSAYNAFEDEQSLMYFPFKHGQLNGVIKLSDFTSPNQFNLRHLRALRIFANPIETLLGNIKSIARLRASIEAKAFQEQMLAQAEALFFYREIALGIFHQVNNRLAALDSELLMMESLMKNIPDAGRDLAKRLIEVKAQITAATELISKAQMRGQTLQPISHKCELIKDIVRPVIEYARNRVMRERSGIDVRHALTDNQYPINIDADLAKESLINIINNALTAIKENRNTKKDLFVGVSELPDENSVEIKIVDSGIGIDPESFKKLFEPFFTTRPKGKGTGLGLFFARKLIEHFSGTVTIPKSNPGKGTTVLVKIPLMRS